jgi:hypothetical protein
MAGIHLLRLMKSQNQLPLPLAGVRAEVLRISTPQDHGLVARDLLLLLLDGEMVADFERGQFAHLRVGEALTVGKGRPLKLSPVSEAVVLWIEAEPPPSLPR